MGTQRRQLGQDLPPSSVAPTSPRVGIYSASPDGALRATAERLADELALLLVAPDDESCDLHLAVTEARIELRPTRFGSLGPVYVDFVRNRKGRRPALGGGPRQPLARAFALRRGKPVVLDTTAGLGADAFLLAALGCVVTAVERSPVVHCLLCDGLLRARDSDSPLIRETVERITLVRGDSRDALARLAPETAPDVVYLDPMYPPRKKASALAKKQMRILRLLAGDDEDAGELLDLARQVARRRVVVKRQRHAPPLARDRVVAHGGKTTRYDVYLPV